MRMKKPLLLIATAVVAATTFSSCTYDPYYGSSSIGYSTSSYGYGYGYGGSNFSTSYFVSTGDPRWGYDPYCYSYYDYHRRCYYDPYLNGYYPIGYRPQIVIGCPHPYGWNPGHGHCPPPRNIHSGMITQYQNRELAYRNSGHSWARNIQSSSNKINRQPTRDIPRPNHSNFLNSNGSNFNSQNQQGFRPNNSNFKPNHGGFSPNNTTQYPNNGNLNFNGSTIPSQPSHKKAKLPNSYNTPISQPPSGINNSSGNHRYNGPSGGFNPSPSRQPNPTIERKPAADQSKTQPSQPTEGKHKGMRSLGNG